jgi:ATP-binding cassette subfamily F protein uup
MKLLTLIDAELAYGLHPLLDRANLAVQEGKRIGLIGQNGTGKSSLLRVIAGTATLRESVVLRGRFDDIHGDRERWRLETRLTEFLHRFGLQPQHPVAGASGGESKRAAVAQPLARADQVYERRAVRLSLSGVKKGPPRAAHSAC